jgi:demethylspheroidene O-methyltransferase
MVWSDRWVEFRNRLIRDPRFQRFALRFPLTRPIARARSRRVFNLCAGFVYSQVLRACVELKLLEAVASSPLPAEALARQTGLPPERALTLIGAAVSLGLLQRRRDHRISLGPHGAALIGNPWIASFIAHHDHFYRDMSDPVALLAGQDETELQKYWAYACAERPAVLEADAVLAYTRLMSASQPPVAMEVLDAFSFAGAKVLMDVGGGDGSFIAAAAQRHPGLRFIHADLAAVSELARQRLGALGLSSRVTFSPIDFLAQDLPRGADVATLVRIAHDHDDSSVARLFASLSRALPAGGTLVIAEAISGIRGAEAVTDAYFNFYFTAMRSGKTRSFKQLSAMLRAAGFADVRLLSARNPVVASVIAAVR